MSGDTIAELRPGTGGRLAAHSAVPANLGRTALAALALLWGYGVFRLGTLWYSNPDYTFGWFVPLLAGCLAWERWKRRPAPTPPEATVGPIILAGVLLMVMLAASLFLEVVPNWRFAGWMFALPMLGITFAILYLVGGRAWMNHFMFPALFFLVAVPWPARIELPVIELMSKANAAVSTAISNGMGIPAMRKGLLIQTGAGLVGVDEACSGIRSLQSSVMIALFLGELFSYGLLRRVFFLVAGAALAFGCNIVRTTYLVRVCDAKGKEAIEASHDPAGFTILGVTLAGLLVLAWLIRPRGRPHEAKQDTAQETPEQPEVSSVAAPAQRARALGLIAAMAVGAVAALQIGIAAWFGPAERSGTVQSTFAFQSAKDMPGFKTLEISPAIRQMLRFSEGVHAEWKDPQGRAWQSYYLRWDRTKNSYAAMIAAQEARGHAPEVCLKNAGMQLQESSGTQVKEYGGVRFLSTLDRFLDQGRTLHVLTLYWDSLAAGLRDTSTKKASTATGLALGLEALRSRDRGRGEKKVIKLAVWGAASDQEAAAAFGDLLERAISRGADPVAVGLRNNA